MNSSTRWWMGCPLWLREPPKYYRAAKRRDGSIATVSLGRSLFFRFIRGGIAGAISTGATVTAFTGVHSWTQLPVAFSVLGLMAIIGFVTGRLLAVDKFIRSLPEVTD